MKLNKSKLSRRSGQTMVEYIIIVVLVAITLIAVFGKFGEAVGKKTAGATSALDSEKGSEAAEAADRDHAEVLKSLDENGDSN